MKRHVLLPAAFLLLVVAGCGQSGPLYLPGNPSQIRTNPAEGAENEEDEDATRPDER